MAAITSNMPAGCSKACIPSRFSPISRTIARNTTKPTKPTPTIARSRKYRPNFFFLFKNGSLDGPNLRSAPIDGYWDRPNFFFLFKNGSRPWLSNNFLISKPGQSQPTLLLIGGLGLDGPNLRSAPIDGYWDRGTSLENMRTWLGFAVFSRKETGAKKKTLRIQ